MKRVIIFSSPNKASFTMEILKKALPEGFEDAYFFDCFKKSPAPCDGCGFCKRSDGCKHSDLEEFFLEFQKSQEVIIAFPVYNGGFPAPLKALLDRFQQFYNARFFKNKRPPMEGSREVTLVITAGSSTDPLPLITAQLSPLFTICGCKLKKAFLLTGTDGDPKLKTLDF